MKIKKEYTFSNNRQIWRIIPVDTDKLIIEERNPDTREAFFNCLNIKTGKEFFKNLQFKEKFWIGIEAIHNNIIYLHKFRKPDMPGHLGIIAFDINLKKTIWETNDYNFLFVDEDKLYCYRQNFEGRSFFRLSNKTGELIEELADDPGRINYYRKQSNIIANYEDYSFPKQYISEVEESDAINSIMKDIKSSYLISGKIEFIEFYNLLLFNFHHVLPSGEGLKNVFRIVDIDSGKVIFEEELNSGLKAFVPDSFFMKDNIVFLLKRKNKLLVCSISG